MTTHEMNSLNGGNSSLDATSSLPNVALNHSHDVFGQPLSKAPTALGTYEHPLLKSNDQVNGAAQIDPLTGLSQQNSKAPAVYGDEFESGIPPIDYVAHLAGKAMGAVDQAVESGTSVVKQATHTAATQINETLHQSMNTVQEHWNAPGNQLRTTARQSFNQAYESIKQKVTDLAARPDVKDAIQTVTELGRTALEKTGSFIETAQSATEDLVTKAFDSSYSHIDRSPTTQSVSRAHSDHLFMGVIDTGFGAQSHGVQIVDAIQQSSQRFPDWIGTGVGTGHWADELVQFVDVAQASGRSGAVVNLSFDLVQINPDGSMTTRSALTDKEQAALAYAQQHGVLIVASAGNQGGAMSALGQASQTFDNIITVGAANNTHRANYSSYGKGLDLLAPGRTSNSALAGTSLAAAEVTAAIERVWTANPELNPQQVSQVLASTAKDLNTPGWDAQTGFGLLDQSAAINQAKTTKPEKEQPFETAANKKFINQDSTWNSVDAIASERINSIGITVQAGHTPQSEEWQEYRQGERQPSSPSSPSPVQSSGQGSTAASSREVYVIQEGDTLTGISQQKLGSSSLWTRIQKADGSSFSEAETTKE